ncbi:hypothetical protein PSDI105340_09695 [Pseudoalteromonas distincta]
MKASERKVLAHEVISKNKISIALACRTFIISETWHGKPKLSGVTMGLNILAIN